MMESLQSPKEIVNKRSRYHNHIEPVIGSKDIKEIRFKDCQSIVNKAIKEKELSPKTAKNINVIVQTVLNYAIKNEYIDKNPASLVGYPKYDNKYNIDLDLDQIRDLIKAVYEFDKPTYRDIFTFALHGRRKDEILSLQWNQIDFDLKVYHIPPMKNKSRKHDIHGMTDRLYAILKRRYAEASIDPKFSPNDFVFVSTQTGTRYVDISKPFKSLKVQAGIGQTFRFHDFRHLLATYAINHNKENIEFVSQALGHSSIEVTQKYITKDANISKRVVENFLNDFGGQL